MKVIFKIFAGALICLTANALEFNEYGHRSMAMGGVGVAMQHNPYAVFYNPALTSSNENARFGYGLGGDFYEKNILDVFDYKLDNIQDIAAFNGLLENNYVSAKIKGAWALKAPKLFPYGNFGIGFAQSIYVASNFIGSVPTGQTSIGNSVRFNIRRVDVMEIPLSYAFSVDTLAGQLSWGTAVKLMNLFNSQTSRLLLTTDNRTSIKDDIQKTLKGSNADLASNVGLDVGFAYTPIHIPGFTLGVVGKNLNTPKFDFKNGKLTLHPQARLGIAYDFYEYFTIASDIDLSENSMLSPYGEPQQKSQKLGLGLETHNLFVDTRWGIARDLRQDNGAILSFGMGVGLLEFGLAVGTKEVKVKDKRYPRYFAIQLGGNFEF